MNETITITLETVERMKRDLRRAVPAAKSCHRLEALARGLAWANYPALRSALVAGPTECRVIPTAFVAFLSTRGIKATDQQFVDDVLRWHIHDVAR